MFTVYDGYSTRKSDGKHMFFAGANTDKGFVSSYDNIADERNCERVYIIKGGAGCGKSSLMKKVAREAEKHGHKVEYYLCGSDPDSLDCIKTDGRIVMLDGTSPHVREMYCPGASSEIVDMTRFWDTSVLEESRDEIASLTDAKKCAYSEAYKLLGASGLAERAVCSSAEGVYLREKADGFINRLVSRLPKASTAENNLTEYYLSAFTMRGMSVLDTFSHMGKIRYSVENIMNTAQIFMEALKERLLSLNQRIVLAKLPINETIVGIYLPEHDISISVCEKNDDGRNINMARFTDCDKAREVRGKMKLYGAILESSEKEAVARLRDAADSHFKLEKIYTSAMDFARLNEYSSGLTEDILSRLDKR